MSKKTAPGTAPSFAPDLLAATAANALSLVSRVGADEQADLVEAWIAGGNIAAVAAVAAEESAPAAARKTARRGLNVLKSRGVAVPERQSTVSRPFAGNATVQLEATFVPLEAGARGAMIVVAARAEGRDVEMVEVHFNDAVGIFQVSGGRVSSSRMREWETQGRRRRGYEAVPVSLTWARWRVNQARQLNAQSGLLLPLELDSFAHLLTPVPAEAPAHPGETLGLTPDGNAERVARGAGLHMEPELNPLLLSNDTMQEMLTQVGGRIAILGGRQPEQEEIQGFIESERLAATDRFFQENVRRQLASQLLDTLPSLVRRAGPDRGLDLLATRQAILDAGLITSPPSEIPFLVGFFDKTLATMMSRSQGQLSIPIPQRPAASGGPVLSSEQLAAVASVAGQAPVAEATEEPASPAT